MSNSVTTSLDDYESRILHFNLAHLNPSAEYTFRHSLMCFPIYPHTDETRALAYQQLPWLVLISPDKLTHYAEVELPNHAIVQTRITIPRMIGGREVPHPVHMAIHVPQRGLKKAHRQIMARRAATGVPPSIHPKLDFYGITREQFLEVVGDDNDNIPEFPASIDSWQDAMDAATAVLYHHTSLANLNADDGGSIPGTIVNWINQAISDTSMELPTEIASEGEDYLVQTPIESNGISTTSIQPSPGVLDAATGALQYAVQYVQDDPTLCGEQWSYDYSLSSAGYNGSSDAPDASGELVVSRVATDSSNGGWVPRCLTTNRGFSVDLESVVYMPSTGTFTWTGNNLWSLQDTPSLTEDIGDQILAGNAYLQVISNDYPDGLIRGQIVVGDKDDNGMTSLTAKLTGDDVVSSVKTDATGTATLTLNQGKTGLTYDVTLNLGDYGGAVTLDIYIGAKGTNGTKQNSLTIADSTSVGQLSLQVTNSWLRHLSVCIQYLDVGGNVLPPQGWSDRIPSGLRDVFEPDPNKPFVQLLSPVTTVFGVPLPASPTTITVPVWNEVHTIRFLCGGLGQGSYDANACAVGITVTSCAELALPPFLLAAGTAIMNSNAVKSLMADTEVLFSVCAAGSFLVAGSTAAYLGTSQNPAAATEGLAEKFGPLFLSPTTSLGLWVLKQISEAAAEEAVPFVDIGLMIINAAVTASELSQTTVEVLDSPFVYEVDVTRSANLNITLLPDSQYHKFPDYHDYFKVTVVYDIGTTLPIYQQSLPSTTLSEPITVTFGSVPAGGNLRVFAVFYASDGWQSGQGQSDWIPAFPDDDGNLSTSFEITINEIPLSITSIYTHNEKIILSPPPENELIWQACDAPIATIQTPSPYGEGKQLLTWSGITIAQYCEMVGYSYQSTGLNLPLDNPNSDPYNDAMWTVRNLSVLQLPQSEFSYPPVGFSAQAGIAYDLSSADDGTGNNYFIESTNGEFNSDNNPAGGYHARRLVLKYDGPPPTFSSTDNQSYGRFPLEMNRYAYHPQGYLFGIRQDKLFCLQLLSTPVADSDAPIATQSSGQGTRYGLLYGAVALVVGLDGRLLVLESLNGRIQAFDIYGKPIQYFNNPDYNPNNPDDPNNPPTIPTLKLLNRVTDTTYLDLAIEAAGYLYVLSYTGNGSQPIQYQVDIYQPDGTFLVTTPNVAAANITVDILRSLYTLNYETILDPGGRPQPSISQWLPPAPPPNQLEAAQRRFQ